MKNFTTPALAALFLAAGLAVGCDQSSSDAASGALDGAKSTAGDAAEGSKKMAGDAATAWTRWPATPLTAWTKWPANPPTAMNKMAGDAADGAKDMGAGTMDEAKKMAGDAKESMGEGMDMSKLTEGMNLSEEQATSMLDKVKDMISSGNTEGASSIMEKLQTMELPASIQPQVDKVKTMLDQAMKLKEGGVGNALQGLGK